MAGLKIVFKKTNEYLVIPSILDRLHHSLVSKRHKPLWGGEWYIHAMPALGKLRQENSSQY